MWSKQILNIIKYKIARRTDNLYVFSSFSGHYSDSPKCLSEELHRQAPDADIVWLIDKDRFSECPDYVKKVDIKSSDAYRYKGKATVLIDNVYGGKEYTVKGGVFDKIKGKLITSLFNKKNQPLITTFHGSAFKCAGRDVPNSRIKGFMCKNTVLILGNQFSVDIYRHITFDSIPIKLMGTPRNDKLFVLNESIVSGQKKKMGIDPSCKVVMYAPTFRSDGEDGVGNTNIRRSGIDQLLSLDGDKLFLTLNQKFGGDWILICRFHYFVEQQIDWDVINKKFNGKIINGNKYDDMAEYLSVTDLLITDSSSTMFDFIHTGKPCLLFFPDWQRYESKERGFYIKLKELPFKLAENQNQLLSLINEFDELEYLEALNSFKEKMGYVDDADSSKRIVKYILEKSWINDINY